MLRPTRFNPLLALSAVATVLVAVVGLSPAAHAEAEMASSLVIDSVVADDGTIEVTETLTFDEAGPSDLSQRIATTKELLDKTQLEYTISDIEVTGDGQSLTASVTTDGDYQVIAVDASSVKVVTIAYRASGAAVAEPQVAGQEDRTEVSWRFLQGLSVGATKVSGEITLPLAATVSDMQCQAGPPAALATCSSYSVGTHGSFYPSFTDGPRGPGEVVMVTLNVPTSAVAANQVITEKWSLDRAFSVAPLPLGVAAGLLAGGVALLYLAHRRYGSDLASVKPALVAQFQPVAAGEERFVLSENLRPGEIGTLADERVDPIDITATVIDVAQRGYLTIVELPRDEVHRNVDWTFERRKDPADLHDYERTLIDVLAPVDGPAVELSKVNAAVNPVIATVQEQIYADVVADGLFVARPDDVRRRWWGIGLGSLIVSVLVLLGLIAFTRFGVAGLVLVGLAIGLFWIGQEMPRRTAKGTSLLKGLDVLAITLATQPTSNVPASDAYGEISRVLPYAIVLGSFERWLDALVAADDDPGVPDPEDLDWYRAPDTWQLSDMPSSIDGFVTTMQGKLFSRG